MSEAADRIATYQDRHLKFWRREAAERPMVICVFGGWSPWRNIDCGQGVDSEGESVEPADLRPERFRRYYERFYELEAAIDDDGQRTALPYPAIPWLEGIIGCSIHGENEVFWSEPIAESLGDLPSLRYDPAHPWAEKYIEFLDYLAANFSGHPVAQSVVRGPTDLLSASLGDQAAIMALVDDPSTARQALEAMTEVFMAFIRHQWEHIPPFRGGYVIGQYELWGPEPVARLQEDAIALYSPSIYRHLALPCDVQLCSLTPYNLMHLHSSCIHLLDDILSNENLSAVQMSKDEGSTTLEGLMPALTKIQSADKSLLVKGRFTLDDVAYMKENLRAEGLCIEPVIDHVEEAHGILPAILDW